MSKYVRTPIEKELVDACQDVKIKHVTKEDAERLIEIVGKWGFYMGTTNRLSSDDIIALCKFLKDNYDYLTLKEMTLILNLNLKGTLGELPFYGTMSPKYMSQVINAYLEYKRENLKDVLDRKYNSEIPETPKLSQEESHAILCDIIRTEYQKFRKGGQVDDLFSIIYNYLTKANLIDLSEEPLKVNGERYAEIQSQKSSVKEANSFQDLLRNAYNRDVEAAKIRYFKNYVVAHFFSKIIDIEEFINSVKVDEID